MSITSPILPNAPRARGIPVSSLKTKPSLLVTGLKVLAFSLLVLLAAIFLGGASALLPWWWIVAGLLLPMVLVLAITAPEFAIMVTLLFLCGVLPQALGPRLAVGPGTIKTHELAIGLLFVFALIKSPGVMPLGTYWGWLRPTFVMLLLLLVGAAVGRYVDGSGTKEILNDGRNHVGWVLAFTVVCLVRTRKQLDRLQWGLVFVGLVVAAVTLAQFVLGRPLIQNARVEDLNTLNQANPDVARSFVGGGIYFVVFSILFLLARLMTRSVAWVLALPLIGLMVAALVVTFGRGVWFATFGVALVMAFWLIRWKGVVAMVAVTIVGMILGLGALGLYKPNVVIAAVDRVLSAGNETTGRNTTLGWRIEEANFALKKIKSSPIIGIGLGTPYKPLIRMNGLTVTDSDELLTRYIHNAYLGLWLKFGIFGPVVIAWFVWGFVTRGRRMTIGTEDLRLKALSAATVGTFIVPAVASVTQPEWLSEIGVAVFALMLGIQIVIHRIAAAAEAAKPLTKPQPIPVRRFGVRPFGHA